MAQLKFSGYIISLILVFRSCSSYNNNTFLIIVSFDGFRYDYFDRNLTSMLVNLKMNSSYSPYMTSVFPTKTYPNHFSIATGLYAEVHGVLDNIVYDQASNKTLEYGYELFHYNECIVPIWTLNENGGGGRRSGCMMWPGSDFKYQDTFPSHYMSYNGSVKWHTRVDTFVSWFKDPETPINLGMLYFEQPDLTCHSFGPYSEQVNKEIARVNEIVQYLLKKFDEIELLSRLNIVFLSDHGAQAVKYPENIINLNNFIDKTWYNHYGVPPNLQVYPLKEKEAEVLAALRAARKKKGGNFSTYTQEEMPDHWHYSISARTPPILITADTGFLFNVTSQNYKTTSTELGTHGYDPLVPTMRAFFLATGPLFKRNYTVPPFENINIFPLAAHMLGLILPALKPNGSLKYLQDILVTDSASIGNRNDTAYLVAGLIIGLVCVITVFSWFFVHRNHLRKEKLRKSSSASYKALTQRPADERSFDFQETLSSDCDDESPT